MRIIAGSAKGLFLKTAAAVTRPTMDRVRAAIFSTLGDSVPGAHVLDLFAGTGAMGIEALSRGAASALFIDNNAKAAALIKQNLVFTKLHGDVSTRDAFSVLNQMPEERLFDLVFADPPYAHNKEDINLAASLLTSASLLKVMAPEALLILECEKKQELPEVDSLEILTDRIYGASRVLIMRAAM
ncbi:MAG: 16S rRNA (guanine(966)-N(2))-methyltransferase RsmD [Verrucomicrobia bacterium RIFCSPHIGHO2_12_FULL_41_10]|nr:MAG: 16S rRNA (guanine(966)-N(2))-methyltransferase RsmD [Verrucomicrobia bacterium RIFCSPHIGHO2_12_FULL_41_10]HLB32999.1 16S rRNA (guanine(966)-N(2))-methyltransferase RsmD [Chthoniobacterales bacterium]